MNHGNQPVRVTERNGGMASGILRATARFTLLAILLGLAFGFYVFLKM